MMGHHIHLLDPAEPKAPSVIRAPDHRLRLLIVMAQGSEAALPEAWRSYARLEDARSHAREALRTPRVLRVAIVEDGPGFGGCVNPLRFVEWVG